MFREYGAQEASSGKAEYPETIGRRYHLAITLCTIRESYDHILRHGQVTLRPLRNLPWSIIVWFS